MIGAAKHFLKKHLFGNFPLCTSDVPPSSLRLPKACVEVRIPAPWGFICGKWWGDQSIRPILCLHNFQENCGSFDRLIPMLTNNVGFLAIDLPGHGLSTHIQRGLCYSDIFFITAIHHIKNYFKWDRISLLGHSNGAVLAYLYALMSPTNCDFAIYLDAFYPTFDRYGKLPKILADATRVLELDNDIECEPPVTNIIDLKRNVYLTSGNSIEMNKVSYIMDRNIKPSSKVPRTFYFSKDPRLHFISMRSISKEECLTATKDLTFPILLTKTENSPRFLDIVEFNDFYRALASASKFLEFSTVYGTHHMHLNQPELLVDLINDFLRRNDHRDRRNGGLALVNNP